MKAKIGSGILVALVAMVALLSLVPSASAAGINLTVTDYEPTALSHTYGGDWVNFTWTSTNVNDTDGYNATITDCSNTSLIGTWYNVSSGTGTVDWATDRDNAWLEVSLTNYETVSIEVWAYNASTNMSANSSVGSGMAQAVTIHDVTVPSIMEVLADNSVAVNVTDAMDSDDTATLTLTFYRNSTTVDAADGAENHYTVTYDLVADSLSSSPSGYVTKTASINTAELQPELGFTFNPADYVAPSTGTEDNITNSDDYVWKVEAELSVNGQGTGNHTIDGSDSLVVDTEMNAYKSMMLSGNQLTIDKQCVPGGTYQFSPDLVLENTGNIPFNLSKSMSDLTSNSYSIPAGNIYLDDDPYHDESTETDAAEEAYSNTATYFADVDFVPNTHYIWINESQPYSTNMHDESPKLGEEPVPIDELRHYNPSNADYHIIERDDGMSEDIYLSNDSENWTLVDSGNYSRETSSHRIIWDLYNDPVAKYVKWDVSLGTTYTGSIYDAKVYTLHDINQITVYNFIEIPIDTQSGHYTGTWTYSPAEYWNYTVNMSYHNIE